MLLAAALCALPAASHAADPLREPLSADEAFSGASFAAPRLSPDGRYLALLASRRGRMGLSIFDLQEGKYTSHLSFADADIAQPMWLGSGRLLYTLAQHGQSRKTQLRQGGLFVVSRDGNEQRKLHATFNDWV
ncbi:hypothetical protein DBR42_26645, partial [Pelomonas sp. HMWF004]